MQAILILTGSVTWGYLIGVLVAVIVDYVRYPR